MKKYVVIFLFSLYLFGATDAYQLLKLPLFVEHYLVHKQQNPDLSIAGFLQIHYNDGLLVVDADFDQDMQLPFKTTPVVFSQTTNIIVPFAASIEPITPHKIKEVYIIYNQQVNNLNQGKSIFQPPRQC
ncbi:hypothetical protein FRZ67_10930 [Panacibacter ginsenosidivorans]|uniref:Uncharacterized protein n=1 Tax=Panacibacter ginsenosidivorans TaxID=1813871 RepID=A0A5B8V8Q2_9BACT|nr:hypothetical protein [Panacibacter ginsenosidivorans]QEC67784.1 hypothetical protein FRZ67_10930 [Panacibacter ginsenosidivorans]